MKKILLMLMFILGFASLGYAVTIDLGVNNGGWKGNNYTNSYNEHTLETDDYIVTISKGSKQSQTITDYPVVKASDITLAMKNGVTLKSVKVNFKQWGTRTQNATISYSTDGSNFTPIGSVALTGNVWAIETGALPAGVVAVKAATTNTSNQVGVVSIDYDVNPVVTGPVDFKGIDETPISVMEGLTSESFITATELPLNFDATSNKPGIADVVKDGWKVKGISAGNAVITLTWDGDDKYNAGSTTIEVTVTEKQKLNYTFPLNGQTKTIKEGSSLNLLAGLSNLPEGIAFSTTNSNVSVDANTGVVTAISAGDAVIDVEWPGDDIYNAGYATVNIKVEAKADFTAFNQSLTMVKDGTAKIFTVAAPGDVTFTGYNSSVISIAEDGTVTGLAAGQTSINVSWSGNADYKGGNTTVAVTVAKSAKTTTFDFIKEEYGMTRYNTGNTYNAEGLESKNGDVTLIHHKNGGNGTRLWSTSGLRFYSKSYIDVTVPEGYTIISVDGTYSANNFKIEKVDDTKWTVSYIPESSNSDIKTLTVKYIAPAQPFTGIKSEIGTDDNDLFMVGETTSIFIGEIRPTAADGLSISVNTQGQSVVDVDENGNVTAKKEGTAILTVKWNAFDEFTAETAGKKITISVTEFKHVEFIDYKSEVSVVELGSVNLFNVDEHTPIPANNLTFEYDPTYITIDAAGNVTAKGVAAQTVVTVTMKWAEDDKYLANENGVTVTVTINPKPEFTGINSTLPMMTGGKANIFDGNALPEGLTGIEIVNNNPEVVEVNAETGEVTALALGKATIDVSWTNEGNYTAGSAKVNVSVNKGIDLGIANLPWTGTGYGEREFNTDEYYLYFKDANKPATSSAVSDVIVARSGDIILQMKNQALKYVKFNFKRWNQNNQTATIYYSTDGNKYYEVYENSTVTIAGNNLSIDTRDLCEQYPNDEIHFVKVTLGISTQVGVASIEYETALPKFNGVIATTEAAPLTIVKGKSVSLFNEDVTIPANNLTFEIEHTGEVAADDVVEVMPNGLVNALAVGTSKVIVKWDADDNYRAGEATVYVSVDPKPQFKVNTVFPLLTAGTGNATLNIIDRIKADLNKTGLDSDGNEVALYPLGMPASINFYSNDEEVATVDADGNVTGLKKGHAVINLSWEEDDVFSMGTTDIVINVDPEPDYTVHYITMDRQNDLDYAAAPGNKIEWLCDRHDTLGKHEFKFVSEGEKAGGVSYPGDGAEGSLRLFNGNILWVEAPEEYTFVYVNVNTVGGRHVSILTEANADAVTVGDEQVYSFEGYDEDVEMFAISSTAGNDGEGAYTDIERIELAIRKKGAPRNFVNYPNSIELIERSEKLIFNGNKYPSNITYKVEYKTEGIDADSDIVTVEEFIVKAGSVDKDVEAVITMNWPEDTDNNFNAGSGKITVYVKAKPVFTAYNSELTIKRDATAEIFSTDYIPANVTFTPADETVAKVDIKVVTNADEEDDSQYVVKACLADGTADTTITMSWHDDEIYEDGEVVITVHVTEKNGYNDVMVTTEESPVEVMYGNTIKIVGPNQTETQQLPKTITFESSNEAVATVDGEGNVTGVAPGDAIITVTWTDDDKDIYEAGSATVYVKVINRQVTFDFVNEAYGMTRYTTGQTYNADGLVIKSETDGIVEVKLNGKQRLTNNGLTFYPYAFAEISVPDEYEIIDVKYETANPSSWMLTDQGTKVTPSLWKLAYTKTSSSPIKTLIVTYQQRKPQEFDYMMAFIPEVNLYEGGSVSIKSGDNYPAGLTLVADSDVVEVDDNGVVTAANVTEKTVVNIKATWEASAFFTASTEDGVVVSEVTVLPLGDEIATTVVMSKQTVEYINTPETEWVSEDGIKFSTAANIGATYPVLNSNGNLVINGSTSINVTAPEGYYFMSVTPDIAATDITVSGEEHGEHVIENADTHRFEDDAHYIEYLKEFTLTSTDGNDAEISALTMVIVKLPEVLGWDDIRIIDDDYSDAFDLIECDKDGKTLYNNDGTVITVNTTYGGKVGTKHSKKDTFYFKPVNAKNVRFHYNTEISVPANNGGDEPEIHLMAIDANYTPVDGVIAVPANSDGKISIMAEHTKSGAVSNEAREFAFDSGTTGVGNVAVDGEDAEVEYYNLQGVRVYNPEAGIYIVRRGTVVTKEVIR